MANRRRITIEIGADYSGKQAFNAAERDADRMESKFSQIGKKLGRAFGTGAGDEAGKSFNDRMKGMAGGLMKAFGKELQLTAKPTAMTAATAFSATFLQQMAGALASGVAKLGHGLAAGLALVPAAIATGALALGTLKLALSGVGDALAAGLSGDTEAFNEALEGMAPAAQAVAREIAGMRGMFDELKGSVQEALFAPLVGQLRPLADIYLPQVQGAMTGISRTFGQVGNSLTWWLRTPQVVESVSGALGNAEGAASNVVVALANLAPALLPLVTVGSTFLPGLTGGLNNATARFRDFMVEAERSGRLREWIQGGLDKLKELWETAKQVGRIFGDIAGIANKLFSGLSLSTGGFLDAIEAGTDSLNRFLETARGQTALAPIFATIREVINTTFGTLQRLGGILGKAFGPHLPKILEFVRAFARLKGAVLDTALDALEPILKGIGNVLGNVVLPALTGLSDFLAANQPLLQGIGIAIMTMLVPAFVAWAISAGAAAVATIAATWPILAIGAAIAVLAALVIIHFDTIKRWITGVFNWVRDNWPLLLAILTGPFGIAVLLIKTHWDSIWAAGKAVFNWVKQNWPLLLAILTGPFGLAALAIKRNWDTIKSGARAVKDWIVDQFNNVVGFFSGLPGRISSAVSGMWDGIKSGFKSAINAVIRMWNGFSISFGGYDIPGPGPNIPSFTIDTPNIPYLHTGGVVPGRPGEDVLAILQAGEGVVSVRAMGAGPSAAAAAGGTVVNIHERAFEGAIISSASDAERWVVAAIDRAIANGNGPTNRGRRLG